MRYTISVERVYKYIFENTNSQNTKTIFDDIIFLFGYKSNFQEKKRKKKVVLSGLYYFKMQVFNVKHHYKTNGQTK